MVPIGGNRGPWFSRVDLESSWSVFPGSPEGGFDGGLGGYGTAPGPAALP